MITNNPMPIESLDSSTYKVSRISNALRQVQCQPANVTEISGGEAPVLVRCCRSAEEMDEVYRLVHDTYLERGYCQKQPDGRLIHYPHLDGIAETSTFVAVCEGHVVGTNSLTVDGPNGLHVDDDFKAECDLIRAEGRKLASSWRIATRSGFRNERRIVMDLIQATVDRIMDLEVETVVFTFNPRHERIYKKMLNMQTLARSEGSVDGLENAPAVFMRWDRETCPKRWLRKRVLPTAVC